MTSKKIEGVFAIKFACELLKLVSVSKPWYAPLNTENSLSGTFNFKVAYAHEKINILGTVLNIIAFLFFDVNLNTQDFVYLEFVKYHKASVETFQFSRNAMYAYLLYSCFIYRYVQTVFLCQINCIPFRLLGQRTFYTGTTTSIHVSHLHESFCIASANHEEDLLLRFTAEIKAREPFFQVWKQIKVTGRGGVGMVVWARSGLYRSRDNN